MPESSGGWRLIVAEGQVVGTDHPMMEAPNAMFRFDGRAALDGFVAWCNAGASHHSVLMPGRHATPLTRVADHLRISALTVSVQTHGQDS